MGTDEEVGKNAGPMAASAAVLLKRLAGKKERFSRQLDKLDPRGSQEAVDGLDSLCRMPKS